MGATLTAVWIDGANSASLTSETAGLFAPCGSLLQLTGIIHS